MKKKSNICRISPKLVELMDNDIINPINNNLKLYKSRKKITRVQASEIIAKELKKMNFAPNLPKLKKKGSFSDILYGIVILFIVAFMIILGKFMLGQVVGNLNDSGQIPTETLSGVQQYESRYSNLWDGIFLFLFVGIMVATLILAFMINSHPIFYMVSVFLFAIFILVATIFKDVFFQLTNESALQATSNTFTIIPFMMNVFPLLILIFSIIIAIVMYTKGGE